MPHVIAVSCPSCQQEAMFEFAEAVRISRAEDVEYFRNSQHFEYVFQNRDAYKGHHRAFYYHGLLSNQMPQLDDLPDGYSIENWAHGPYLYRSHELDIGTVVCSRCSLRRKHHLNWPGDAHFRIEHRGETLWAFHKESLIDLIDFIASDDRNASQYKWHSFLRHLPKSFLGAKAREAVLKKLQRLL